VRAGSSDQVRAAERSLAEGLMDLPITDLREIGLDVRGYEAQVLKTSKSRPILRYVVTCFDKKAPRRRVIIGKGYFRHDGARTFEAMRLLWSEGFAGDRFLAIPEPIAFLPRLNLLLQGWAPGDALYAYLEDPERALQHVGLTARWLAKLHRTRIAAARVLPLDYEQTKLRTYGEVLIELCPLFAPRIERIVQHILALLRALDLREVVPTHGDFQPKNIFICQNRVTVIDFDRFALAHPARDVGHFIGQSMTMSYARKGSFEQIEPWNSAFLDEYVRLASPEVLSMVPVFVARTFMEVLKHKIFLDPAKNSYLLPLWLDECERWLDGTRRVGSVRPGESRLPESVKSKG
jgi:hypothetical protein